MNKIQSEEIKRLKKLTEYLYKTQKHKEFVLNKMLESNRIMKKENSAEIKVAVSKAKERITKRAEIANIKNYSPIVGKNNAKPYEEVVNNKLTSLSNFIKSTIKLNPIQESNLNIMKNIEGSNQKRKTSGLKDLKFLLKNMETPQKNTIEREEKVIINKRRRSGRGQTLKFGRLSSLQSSKLFNLDENQKEKITYNLDKEYRNNNKIPTAEDSTFTAIFFQEIMRVYNENDLFFCTNEEIDEKMQKNEKYFYLRNITKSEDKFVEQLKTLDYVASLHFRDVLTHFCVRNF